DALSWTLGIAAYEIKTVRKRHVRRREAPMATPDLAVIADGQADPEELALSRERDDELAEAMAALAEGDAATLRSYVAGERPDVPAATFRKRLQRALDRLRARLEHDS